MANLGRSARRDREVVTVAVIACDKRKAFANPSFFYSLRGKLLTLAMTASTHVFPANVGTT
jgi:hypothetical protein